MKKLLTIISIVLLVLVSACSKTENTVGMKNPMVEYKTTKDLYNACGFPFLNIDGTLNNFKRIKMFYIAESIVEIDYTKDKSELTLRTAKGNKDISGLHYSETTEEKQGFSGTRIIHKKKNNDIIGIWWTNGEYSFSISLKNGNENDFNAAFNMAFIMAESFNVYNIPEIETTVVP